MYSDIAVNGARSLPSGNLHSSERYRQQANAEIIMLFYYRILALLNQYKLIRDYTRDSGKALLKPLLQGIRDMFRGLLDHPRGEARWFLTWGKGRSESKDQAGRRLRWFVHPCGGVECWWHARYSGFAPSSSEAAVGVLLFWYLVVRNSPQLHSTLMHAMFCPL